MRSSGGQTFMPDYLTSIIVFGVILTIFLTSWNSVLGDQTQFKGEEELRFRARHTTMFLVSTPGYPEDWNSSTVQIPGFAEPDHVIQGEKLEEFRDISYNRQRELLKASEYYMTLENSSGKIELNGSDLEFGKNYSDAETIIPFTRTVQLNSSGKIQTAELNYVVWR